MPYEKPKDYREVPERIAEWYARHPEGRIVCVIVEDDETYVSVKASAFRSQDPGEPPSGVGHSSMTKPGKTPYTRDSELENAETSAAGRALVMAGIPAKTVASDDEVRSKTSTEPTAQAENQAPPNVSPGSVEGVTAVEDPSRPVAPISSAEDRRAVTSVEGEEQESGHPLPPSSPELSEGSRPSDESEPGSSSAMGTATPAPDSTRDSLWKQLVEFSGSEAKARNEINSRLKTGWTKGNTEHIPADDIEHTLRAVLQEAG